MDETMCVVDDHTVLSHEVQSYDRPCQILHYDEMLYKSVVSNVKFKYGC